MSFAAITDVTGCFGEDEPRFNEGLTNGRGTVFDSGRRREKINKCSVIITCLITEFRIQITSMDEPHSAGSLEQQPGSCVQRQPGTASRAPIVGAVR